MEDNAKIKNKEITKDRDEVLLEFATQKAKIVTLNHVKRGQKNRLIWGVYVEKCISVQMVGKPRQAKFSLCIQLNTRISKKTAGDIYHEFLTISEFGSIFGSILDTEDILYLTYRVGESAYDERFFSNK